MIEVTVKFEAPDDWGRSTTQTERIVEIQRFCYNPHFDRHDHGLPNPKYLPHVHIRAIDDGGRPVAVIWEGE